MFPYEGMLEAVVAGRNNIERELPEHQEVQNPNNSIVDPEYQERSNRSLALFKERKRRRAFKDLVASLISLVPRQSLEDKRILSDGLASAANYISFLESRIAELKAERDQMEATVNNSESDGVAMRKVGVSRWEVTIMVSDALIPTSDILSVFQSHGFDIEGAHCYMISSNKSLHTFLVKGEEYETKRTVEALIKLLNKEESATLA